MNAVRHNFRDDFKKSGVKHTKVKIDASPTLDIYSEVTARIIAQLEAGVAPWACPWGADKAPISLPRNAVTGRNYSGVNVLLLWAAVMDNSFASNVWMTFNQARDIGASVRKGSKGTMIVFADRFVPKNESERAACDGDEARGVFFMEKFYVFNADQIDNLPAKYAVEPLARDESEQLAASWEVIRASGADFRIGGDKAFYVPSLDYIAVPKVSQFHDQINWNRTALHELSHWTGHKSRLDRNLLNEFGSKDYAREELIAEMGSAFVCASLGIQPTVRHADYLGSWLAHLKEDNRAIFKAASGASKAADFILSRGEA
jgi:antirestriction protein ArdC